MIDIHEQQQHYWQLLHQPESLFLLHQAQDVEHFIVLMADFLNWPELNLEQMLAFIALQQQGFIPDLARFSQVWFPARYHAQTKTISWVPVFKRLSKLFWRTISAMLVVAYWPVLSSLKPCSNPYYPNAKVCPLSILT